MEKVKGKEKVLKIHISAEGSVKGSVESYDTSKPLRYDFHGAIKESALKHQTNTIDTVITDVKKPNIGTKKNK